MNGLVRVFFAACGRSLRLVAVVPIGCGDILLRIAAWCERQAKPTPEH